MFQAKRFMRWIGAVYTGAFALSAIASPFPDAFAPLTDSKILVPTQVATIGWLDDKTLAITTFAADAKDRVWTDLKVVAFDVESRSVRDIVPKGTLICSDAHGKVASVMVGDMRAMFRGGTGLPQPMPRLHQWTGTALVDAHDKLSAQNWHITGCDQVRPEHARSYDPSLGREPLRILQLKHGHIEWSQGGGPVVLRNGAKETRIDASPDNFLPRPRYLSNSDAYELQWGTFYRGPGGPRDLPLVTMKSGGALTKALVPPALATYLAEGQDAETGWMMAVAPGQLLFIENRFNKRQGAYLIDKGKAERVWCRATAELVADVPCWLRAIPIVSPNGCRVALVASAPAALEGTVQVLELCRAVGVRWPWR